MVLHHGVVEPVGAKKGAHGFGSLIRPRRTASYTVHHNLYAHHSSRNPRPGTYFGKTLRFDFRNNLIYDWGFKAGYAISRMNS